MFDMNYKKNIEPMSSRLTGDLEGFVSSGGGGDVEGFGSKENERRLRVDKRFKDFIKKFNLTKILKQNVYGNSQSVDYDSDEEMENIEDLETVKTNETIFELIRTRIQTSKVIKLDKKNNNWVGFAVNSLCYTAFILIIGIVGANLEQLSELDEDSPYKNSKALRNKFEKMFKHSIFAQQSLKIDKSVNIDRLGDKDDEGKWIDTGELRWWCAACDLQAQATLLLQEWPAKIVDFANSLMCNGFFFAFDSIFTKGRAFRAYFLPILLILLVYLQIPAIMAICAAVLGSLKHPHFPVYWLGLMLIWPRIKGFVLLFIEAITGKLNPCGDIMANTVIYTKDLYDYHGLCLEKLLDEYHVARIKDRNQRRRQKGKGDKGIRNITLSEAVKQKKNRKRAPFKKLDRRHFKNMIETDSLAYPKTSADLIALIEDDEYEAAADGSLTLNPLIEGTTIVESGGMKLTPEAMNLIYFLNITPWWKVNGSRNVLDEINAVRKYNKYMRILYNSENPPEGEQGSYFDYTLGRADTVDPSNNVHYKIINGNIGEAAINELINKFIDLFNNVKCDVKLINAKGLPIVADSTGCLTIPDDDPMRASPTFSGFLRYLVPHISGTNPSYAKDVADPQSDFLINYAMRAVSEIPVVENETGSINVRDEVETARAMTKSLDNTKREEILRNVVYKHYLDTTSYKLNIIRPNVDRIAACEKKLWDELNLYELLKAQIRGIVGSQPDVNNSWINENRPYAVKTVQRGLMDDAPKLLPTKFEEDAQTKADDLLDAYVKRDTLSPDDRLINLSRALLLCYSSLMVYDSSVISSDGDTHTQLAGVGADGVTALWRYNVTLLEDGTFDLANTIYTALGNKLEKMNMLLSPDASFFWLSASSQTALVVEIKDKFLKEDKFVRSLLKIEIILNITPALALGSDDFLIENDTAAGVAVSQATDVSNYVFAPPSGRFEKTVQQKGGGVNSNCCNGKLRGEIDETFSQEDVLFYAASPFCNSPVKNLVNNISSNAGKVQKEVIRNHQATDVRNWFWSRTTFETRQTFYNNMREIISYDTTIATAAGLDDVSAWKNMMIETIVSIEDIDEQYTNKNAETSSAKKAKFSVVKKINKVYNDKIFSGKKRFNKIMTLIHIIVLINVIVYMWEGQLASQGIDPNLDLKKASEDLQRERKLVEEARQASSGGGKKGGGEEGDKPSPPKKKKESMLKKSIFNRLPNRKGPGDDSQAEESDDGDDDNDEPVAPSNKYPIINKIIQPLDDARRVAENLVGPEPNFPNGEHGRVVYWTGSGMDLIGKILRVFLVITITVFVACLGLLEQVPKVFKQIKEAIRETGKLYKNSKFLVALFIQLIPIIVLFYTIGLWFAPTYGLGICIAYAIFVQIKMTAFVLFGAKNADLTKAHLRKNRYGLTFMTLLMIAYNANQNLQLKTSVGVTVAFAICMFIMLCR